MKLNTNDLVSFLEEKHDLYNRFSFIETDPISIPHQFTKKEDIEIAGFLTATIAWGQRKTILGNANKLMKLMGHSPYEFIMNIPAKDEKKWEKTAKKFNGFKHRTFNGEDCNYFVRSLANIYQHHNGLESLFMNGHTTGKERFKESIIHFRKVFFEIPFPRRVSKHISNPGENSAAKRINMFLRWMVRKDKRGVDFGTWNQKDYPAFLYCPLDVHSGSVARKLGIPERKQNDWKAVEELTDRLKSFDPHDPVKYDFALFGLGVHEKF